MHLFGDRNEPHLVHFEAQRERGSVVLTWDVRNAPALSWRVVSSERGFAEKADALPGSGQTLISESANCGARDDQIADGRPYFYTVFAQDGQGVWHLQVKTQVAEHEHLRWHHPASDFEKRPLNADADYCDEAGVVHEEANMKMLLLANEQRDPQRAKVMREFFGGPEQSRPVS